MSRRTRSKFMLIERKWCMYELLIQELLWYKFICIQIFWADCNQIEPCLVEQCLCLTAKDILIYFSFPLYSIMDNYSKSKSLLFMCMHCVCWHNVCQCGCDLVPMFHRFDFLVCLQWYIHVVINLASIFPGLTFPINVAVTKLLARL